MCPSKDWIVTLESGTGSVVRESDDPFDALDVLRVRDSVRKTRILHLKVQ